MNNLINLWYLGRRMKCRNDFCSFLPYLSVLCISGLFIITCRAYSADPQYVFEFDKASINEDGWSDSSLGGFSGNPAGIISSGVQLLSPFTPKSKDNLGLTLTVKRAATLKALDEVCFVYCTTEIDTLGKPVLITASIQSERVTVNASIMIGALKGDLSKGNVDGSIASVNPKNVTDFISPQRIACVYKPDSGERYITPFIQVAAKKLNGTVTIYVDRIEVYLLDKTQQNFPLSLFDSELEDVVKPPPPAPVTIALPGLPIDATPLEMVYIPAGTFVMGSPDNAANRHAIDAQHIVTITQSFYMGKYEVTQAQWQALMGRNPSSTKGDNLPVEQISWDDCQLFIQKLNALGQGIFRLPTEAEWEYACRAGTITRYYWGDEYDMNQMGQYAWNGPKAADKTHNVGLKLPNAWGLFDMCGNVSEWCQDWFISYYFSEYRQTDPQGADTGTIKVIRGGDYRRPLSSAYRLWNTPDNGSNRIGLRVVRTQ